MGCCCGKASDDDDVVEITFAQKVRKSMRASLHGLALKSNTRKVRVSKHPAQKNAPKQGCCSCFRKKTKEPDSVLPKTGKQLPTVTEQPVTVSPVVSYRSDDEHEEEVPDERSGHPLGPKHESA